MTLICYSVAQDPQVESKMIDITFAPPQEEVSERLEEALRNCIRSLLLTRLESKFADVSRLEGLRFCVLGNWTEGDFDVTVTDRENSELAARTERALADLIDERPRVHYSVA
jgi:hypothetical protein